MKTLGERIKEIRTTLGLSQEVFGSKIGVNKSSVSRFEKDHMQLSNSVVRSISANFFVNEKWILTGSGEMFAPELREQLKDLVKRKQDEFEINSDEIVRLHKLLSTEDKLYLQDAISNFYSLLSILEEGEDVLIIGTYIRKINLLISSIYGFTDRIMRISDDYEELDLMEERFQVDYKEFERQFNKNIHTIFEIMNGEYVYENNDDEIIVEEPAERYGLPCTAEAPSRCVQLLGKVAAGVPIEAINSREDLINVPGSLSVDFALAVKGDSMEPMIKDGSVIFIKSQEDLELGEIGIFQIDEHVTCKRYYRDNGNIVLRSINTEYPDFIIGSDSNIKIIGKVVM